MGPENIEQLEPKIDERADEHYDDYDEDMEEHIRNMRKRFNQAKRDELLIIGL